MVINRPKIEKKLRQKYNRTGKLFERKMGNVAIEAMEGQ